MERKREKKGRGKQTVETKEKVENMERGKANIKTDHDNSETRAGRKQHESTGR